MKLIALAIPLLGLLGQAEDINPSPSQPFQFLQGDRICMVGNALAERMQHHGWLETLLQARLPKGELSFRNLGFGADTLTIRQRTAGFGTTDDYLTRCRADVVFAFFGYNESFAGVDGLEDFKRQLAEFISHTLEQEYNGDSAPRLVLFSPIANENLGDPNLPATTEENERIALYVRAMSSVAASHNTRFVDLFSPTMELFARTGEPLTINGIHLTEHGNLQVARLIESNLFLDSPTLTGTTENEPQELQTLRNAVLQKNLVWFNRYRATDGYNVYGGRSSLEYSEGISNFTVLQREMEILDVMASNRDERIWAMARGDDITIDDSNAPPAIGVKTNKPGTLADGRHEFPSGEEAIDYMQVADGMRVNLYADEARFPELVNPVQMSWDTRNRLWVAAWPTYPHVEPHQPMNDKLLILEDTDGDGDADRCKIFAGDLHNPTGFEFWMGGVLLAQPPDLLFLKDTDGDDVADVRERLLHGLSSADTHHSANSFVIGPDGALYFQEGTFHHSQIETIHGPVRNNNGCVWRFEPRTFRVERYIPYGFANPHGHVFDRWGQGFVTDGTGNQNYFALGFSGHLPQPASHRGYFTYFQQRSRPCAGTEILSSQHFPPENQGNLLIADVIQFKGILQYRFTDEGSGFGAVEVDPVVHSAHPTFRPSDIEIGPDGAIYFLDWTNPLIGHMQHHLRDPSRDHDHGRVYRITVDGSELLSPPSIAGQPVEHLFDLLKIPNDRVRYRVRNELSHRDSAAVIRAAGTWVKQLNPADRDYEHYLLEALWVHQQHNAINRPLLSRLLRAEDFRARAAATRVVRYMRHMIPDALTLLKRQANDEHPRVRLEAVVGASFFEQPEAFVVALESLRHATDKYIDYALLETMSALEPTWKQAIREGRNFLSDNEAGEAFMLELVDNEELVRLPRSTAVYGAMLRRHGIAIPHRREAVDALAGTNNVSPMDIVLETVLTLDDSAGPHAAHVIHDLGTLAGILIREGHEPARAALIDLINTSKGATARQLGYAMLITLDGNEKQASLLAGSSADGLRDLLGSVSMVSDAGLRRKLAEIIQPLMFSLPEHLKKTASQGSGLTASYYRPNPKSVAINSFEELVPESSGVAPDFTLEIPLITERDRFALKFSGIIETAADGEYTFYTNSDDGSRLYIDGEEVVDNDGLHGMVEKPGTISLPAGPHDITVTYYDAGGDEGLTVSWQGPGFEKQRIPAVVLSTDTTTELRSAAVRAMAYVPGLADEKFRDATLLIGAGSVVEATVTMIDAIPRSHWPAGGIRPLIDTIGAYVQGLPAEQQTLPRVLAALDLGKRLARSLPANESREALTMLDGLGGAIVLIRTIPHQMLYDVAEFQVAAGQPVAIVLQNNDIMPHNFVVTSPGRLAAVGIAAEKLAADTGEANLDNFIPDTEDVLFFTRLLYPGQTQRLTIVAPERKGNYPFVCTFPGHWTRMNGIMRVVDRVDGDTVIARTQPAYDEIAVRPFVRSWKMSDLVEPVQAGLTGRSMKRGEEMFTVAGCASCHTIKLASTNGSVAGAGGGPDLTTIGEKYKGVDLLRQLLEPSCEINEDYVFYRFSLRDGKDIYGRIKTDDGNALHVLENLQTPDEITIISKKNIREQVRSKVSAMPTGLLVVLTRDEILDLLAFLQSGSQ